MAGSNSIGLSWDPSTDNQAVAGYIVYVDGVLFDSLSASNTSVVVTGLEPETLYTFEVQAFDLAGNLSDFAELTLSTGAPVDAGEDGLVAHYPFEGNADDATPYANHGVVAGDVVFEEVPDRGGMAIKFDGDQDSVLAPNAVQLISDFATVSFWIRVDGQSLQDAEAYVLDFGHWDQRWKISLPQHLRIVWTTNSKNAQFDNAISDMDSKDGNELVKDFWWYVTMVHDGTDDIIYLDGNEVNRKPAAGTLNSTSRKLGMGSNPVDGGQYFNGALDELKIYNRALTTDEVKKLFTSGTTGLKDLISKISSVVEVVYPNPTTERLVVQHQFKGDKSLLLRVFDVSGRQIDAIHFSAAQLASRQISLDVNNYVSGLYSLNFVLAGENMGSIPFIKK
ncbi:MAG: fibronectin type III domain-containing protein [Saprospiraceae bacterium]|nr:fibronectin type III domain-containing protein [Saprospiraceae bacterium]